MLSKGAIDGIVLKNSRKSIECNESSKENNNAQSESDSDEGSEHNIFGSNQIVISK